MISTFPLKWLPLVAACVLLGACATSTSRTGTAASRSQDALRQRAEQRWNELVNKHADKAYDYLTPGYRATISRGRYADEMGSRPIHWQSAKVNKLECTSAQVCMVYMIVNYTLRLPGAGGAMGQGFAPLKENWLFLRDQWYYLPREEGRNSLKAAK